MQPPEEAIDGLVADWLKKAELDLRTAVRLAPEQVFRDIVVFHAQQAAEKYLKALLTKRQLEFPKTHEIRRLLDLLSESDGEISEELADVIWLDPFGVAIRYPSDQPETVPGDEQRATHLAEKTRLAITKALAITKPA
jgi:HEPN domain-containing protein